MHNIEFIISINNCVFCIRAAIHLKSDMLSTCSIWCETIRVHCNQEICLNDWYVCEFFNATMKITCYSFFFFSTYIHFAITNYMFQLAAHVFTLNAFFFSSYFKYALPLWMWWHLVVIDADMLQTHRTESTWVIWPHLNITRRKKKTPAF